MGYLDRPQETHRFDILYPISFVDPIVCDCQKHHAKHQRPRHDPGVKVVLHATPPLAEPTKIWVSKSGLATVVAGTEHTSASPASFLIVSSEP
jgi:hypothetical protein